MLCARVRSLTSQRTEPVACNRCANCLTPSAFSASVRRCLSNVECARRASANERNGTGLSLTTALDSMAVIVDSAEVEAGQQLRAVRHTETSDVYPHHRRGSCPGFAISKIGPWREPDPG